MKKTKSEKLFQPWSNSFHFADWEVKNCHRCNLFNLDDPEDCPINSTLAEAFFGEPWDTEKDQLVGYNRKERPYNWDCPSRNAGFPPSQWPYHQDCADQLPLPGGCDNVRLRRAAGFLTYPPRLRPCRPDEDACDQCGREIQSMGVYIDGQCFCEVCQIDFGSYSPRVDAIIQSSDSMRFHKECEGTVLSLVEKWMPDTPEGWLSYIHSAWFWR